MSPSAAFKEASRGFCRKYSHQFLLLIKKYGDLGMLDRGQKQLPIAEYKSELIKINDGSYCINNSNNAAWENYELKFPLLKIKFSTAITVTRTTKDNDSGKQQHYLEQNLLYHHHLPRQIYYLSQLCHFHYHYQYYQHKCWYDRDNDSSAERNGKRLCTSVLPTEEIQLDKKETNWYLGALNRDR